MVSDPTPLLPMVMVVATSHRELVPVTSTVALLVDPPPIVAVFDVICPPLLIVTEAEPATPTDTPNGLCQAEPAPVTVMLPVAVEKLAILMALPLMTPPP